MPRTQLTKPKILTAIGTAKIKSAARGRKPATVQIVAYGGGEFAPPGFGPTVVDLAGLALPGELPLLIDHENAIKAVAGTGKPTIVANSLVVNGTLTKSTAAGRTIIGLGKDDMKLSASVGINLIESEFIRAGQTVSVNGRRFTAGNRGLLIVRRGKLFEVSFTPVGADETASVAISAKQRATIMAKKRTDRIDSGNSDEGDNPVDLTSDIRAAAVAETKRIANIRTLCAAAEKDIEPDELGDIEASAIDDGWDEKRTQLQIIRASRPSLRTGRGTRVVGTMRTDASNCQVLEAALCLNAGMGEEFVGKQYAEPIMNAAVERQMRSTSIHSIFRAVCRAAGTHTDNFRDGESIRAAFEADRTLRASGFSTVSLPGILGNVANKAMLSAYNAVATTWRTIAAVRSNVDFKAHSRYRMTGQGQFQKVGPDGELKSFTVAEKGYNSQLDTFGSVITLTRQMIINDDLSAFTQLPRIIGRQAAIAVDKAVFTLVLSNPSNFFHADNKNYFADAAATLSTFSISKLETLFLKQVDSNNDPVLIVPKVLLTPPELAVYASQLVSSIEIRNTADNKEYVTGNPHAGRFSPVSSPWLSTTGITGNSTTGWYLFAEPGDVAAIAVAFLNGKDQPTIESGDTSFDTLGLQWRGYFDFAVAMEDFRAAAHSKGTA